MKEQSAIDFLHSKILFNIGLDDNDIFKLRELVKIAKKLEEKQHGKTWDSALDKYEVRAGNYMRAYEDFDDYFYETFVSKGSDKVELPKQDVDELIKIIKNSKIDVTQIAVPNESLDKYKLFLEGYDYAKSTLAQLPQQEISDEEIYEGIIKHCSIPHDRLCAEINAMIGGAKWYREQLKQL